MVGKRGPEIGSAPVAGKRSGERLPECCELRAARREVIHDVIAYRPGTATAVEGRTYRGVAGDCRHSAKYRASVSSDECALAREPRCGEVPRRSDERSHGMVIFPSLIPRHNGLTCAACGTHCSDRESEWTTAGGVGRDGDSPAERAGQGSKPNRHRRAPARSNERGILPRRLNGVAMTWIKL